MLKVERDTGDTATRRGSDNMNGSSIGTGDTLTRMQRESSLVATESQTFRLARLGVGWVAGTMEFFQM